MMERQAARVVSGLRGDRKDEASKKVNPILKYRPEEGVFVFKARAANYRLQYTAPATVTKDSETGRTIKSNPKALLWKNYVYKTSDLDEVNFIVSRQAYGLGRDFWLLEDEQKVIIKDQVNGLLGQLSVIDPSMIPGELKAKLLGALGEAKSEMNLPPAPPQ